MRSLKVAQTLLLMIVTAACGSVYSTKPLGTAPNAVEADDWEGVWSNEDGYLVLQVTDAKAGLLRLGWIDEDLQLESHEVMLREAGGWVFGSLKEKDQDRFLWARIKKDENRILVWTPSVSKIRALVEEGALPGTVEKGGVVTLGELNAEHLELIASEKRGNLLDWEDPVVLFRQFH